MGISPGGRLNLCYLAAKTCWHLKLVRFPYDDQMWSSICRIAEVAQAARDPRPNSQQHFTDFEDMAGEALIRVEIIYVERFKFGVAITGVS